MQNQWLLANQNGLEKIRTVLIQMEYLPIFQDYPVRVIQALLNGFEHEINKLQEEVVQLKLQNEKLKKDFNEVKKETESEQA